MSRRMNVRFGIAIGLVAAVVFGLARSALPVAVAAGLALVAALIVGLSLAYLLNRTLLDMRKSAVRIAEGDLSSRVAVPNTLELAQMAEALNFMAARLQERIVQEHTERMQQQAVLSSMIEGVFAVNNDEQILSMNAAAAELLQVRPEDAIGKELTAVLRNSALQSFIEKALESDDPVEEEIMFHLNEERTLQTHGATLRDPDGASIGAVIVMNDVTRLRRLERIRRDFVSNVSHELKTPITSVKGFVETLLDGALDDPGDARHFLTIVQKHAERLNSIIDDLLILSRLEQDEGEPADVFQVRTLAGPVKEAIQLCAPVADQKKIKVNFECVPDVQARINARLLEQSMVNLIDNALKYSGSGSTVNVSLRKNGQNALIAVKDEGAGIPPEHIPRLFERFYRVDKARSRDMGGTGLGLAIVRHIVQSHGGQISVDSQLGRGSTFTIQLPLAKDALTEL